MPSRLRDKYDEAYQRKGSILCVGIDPPFSEYRGASERREFCLRIIREAAAYALAVKINENFVRDFSLRDHIELTEEAKRQGLLAIYDCKLGDIGSTAESGVSLIREMGYDAFTANPILGNIDEIAGKARKNGLGVLPLVTSSNPSSGKYYKREALDGKTLFQLLVDDSRDSMCDGVVIGISPHLSEEDVRYAREGMGEEALLLFAGVGAQGGDAEKALRMGGERVLVNVGRSIALSPSPAEEARRWRDSLTGTRDSYVASETIINCTGALQVPPSPVRLASGMESSYYIDCRAIYSHPRHRSRIVRMMVGLIRRVVGNRACTVAGTATAGIPIASLVADRMGAGLVYVRAGKKDHGLGRDVEGVLRAGDYVIGVDDLTTTGRSALSCIEAVRRGGGVIDKYFVIVDRCEGARELLAGAGVELYALTDMKAGPLRRHLESMRGLAA